MNSEHIYGLAGIVHLYMRFLLFLGSVWTIFGLLTFLPPLNKIIGDSVATTTVGAIFLILMIILYFAIKPTRLILTQDGIAYYTLGYRIYTPWQNIMRLEKVQPYPFTILHSRRFTGFKLRQKYVMGMSLEEGRRRGIAVMETDWWNPAWSMYPLADIFPITDAIAGHNWIDNKFGQNIRLYIPSIFNE